MSAFHYFVLIFALLLIGSSAHASSWSAKALQSASASASAASQQSCVEGFNQVKERRESKAYEQHQGYQSQCSQGEAWGKCLRRLYFGQ